MNVGFFFLQFLQTAMLTEMRGAATGALRLPIFEEEI